MRLSDAIMLGSTTCKMVPCDIDFCAIGAALNALGIPKSLDLCLAPVRHRGNIAMRIWPWLSKPSHPSVHTWSYFNLIAFRFDNQVCNGLMTLEQLVDYVRSVEPAEDESPENGQVVVETALEYAPV